MIPKDKIIENLYTNENKFVYKNDTKKFYKGYYCNVLINSKFFTGKTFNKNSKELLESKFFS